MSASNNQMDVEANGSRRAPEGGRVSGEHHAETFAEDINPDTPDEGRHQGGLQRPSAEDADADGDLDQPEDGNPHGRLVVEEVRHVADRRTDERRLTGRHRPDHRRDELGLEQIRLKLEDPVEDPAHTQGDLQSPLIHVESCRDRRCRNR
jgi:hypothetical protein